MAGTFPTLSGGQVCFYPAQRGVRAATRVIRFANDMQQRFQSAPILNSWVLEYKRISYTDLSTLRTFFDTQKGQFDKSWVFPFDGTNYTAMTFEQDDFSYTEAPDSRGRYNLTLRCRQVAKSGSYASGLTAVFPSISTGIITQLPFTSSRSYKTIVIDTPGGARYTYAQRSSPLHRWTLEFSVITKAEMETLLNFFLSMNGSLSTFSFTDPVTSVAHSNVHFAEDAFQATYRSAAICSTRIELEEHS